MPLQLTIGSAIALWLLVTCAGPVAFLPIDASNLLVMALLFFNNLNLLIALCEICLGLYIKEIQSDYQVFQEKYRGKRAQAVAAYFHRPLPNPFDGRAWSAMWSTYALYDPSYQNHESFGFFIDVGNGVSTIPPCLLWNYALIYPEHVSPLLVGCVGLASYWQILYGTVIYFFSFFFNQRYKGMSWPEAIGFVGIANSVWFFFPIIGIYAAVIMLRDGDLSVFQSS